MYELRTKYDTAVYTYGKKYDLKTQSNDSEFAQQMAHTIKVYDYYYELNSLVLLLKDTENYLWKDVTSLTPEQFETRLKDLKTVINDNKTNALRITKPSINESLQDGFIEFHKAFEISFEEQTQPIITILQAYSINDKTNIIEKTEAFNKAKTWFNNNRREAYTLWSRNKQLYLRSEIKPL